MNKLRRKLFIQVAGIISVVFVISLVINIFFLPRYFLHQKKLVLENLAIELAVIDEEALIKEITHLEKEHNLMITYVAIDDDINDVNSNLLEAFRYKGLALSKFWITPENLEMVVHNQIVNKLYDQEKMKSSLLVMFMKKGNWLFAFGDSIAYSDDTIKIINQFHFYVFLGALLLTIFLTGIFAKRIVYPLEELQKTAKNISNLNFTKARIKTGDEIEDLAASINIMSDKLQTAHKKLDERNKNLQIFISDISHELKTPLSLIKAYSAGLKDGLDDGSFTDIIQKQVDDISNLVDRLLELAKLQADFYTQGTFCFHKLFLDTMEKYHIQFQEKNLTLTIDHSQMIESLVIADKIKIEMVLNNFISNAIAYTTNQKVEIIIKNTEEFLCFSIKNGIGTYDEQQLEKIWEPFYVLESSRNKKISATGLGLSIVATILQKHQAAFGYHVDEEKIEFYFSLPSRGIRIDDRDKFSRS